ncbi:DUF1878 family protein [Neobacillus drentensis]|uniref:DUF1878 family protein n=1 Tax=Neobacillus drentensis TaxID=220684 RepID=UPI002FFE7E59
MTEYELLLKKVSLLEYHQKLLLELLNNPKLEFYKLIIEKGISKQEVKKFFQLCDEMSIKLEEQKAEGYVYFHPLFDEISASLPGSLEIKEVLNACIKQGLFKTLFLEFKKYI